MKNLAKGFKRFMVYIFAGALILIFFIGSSISINYNFDRTKDRSQSSWKKAIEIIKDIKDVVF